MISADTAVTFSVNRQQRTVTADPQRSLLDVLREELHLTGTRYGCGAGDCGACSVLLDGKRAFACSTPVGEAAGKTITTIEGLADGEKLHPVQQAFVDEGAYQCGYCTSGMIIAAVALLAEKAHPSEAEVREGMNPNLCRCCGYTKIISAVRRAAAAPSGG